MATVNFSNRIKNETYTPTLPVDKTYTPPLPVDSVFKTHNTQLS